MDGTVFMFSVAISERIVVPRGESASPYRAQPVVSNTRVGHRHRMQRSNTSQAISNVLRSHRIISTRDPHSQITQPLDVLIFGPLTSAYQRLVSHAAERWDAVDKAHFRRLYAWARDKVLTQMAARKAFLDRLLLRSAQVQIMFMPTSWSLQDVVAPTAAGDHDTLGFGIQRHTWVCAQHTRSPT